MIKRTQSLALLVAAAALLAVPAVGQAHKTGAQHNHGTNGKAKGKAKCVVNKGFVVKGTLASDPTLDDPATTNVNEGNVEITVTNANRHARISGEFTDQNPGRRGIQVSGDDYTADGTPGANGTDPFGIRLVDYEPGEAPAAGDKVRIAGKIAVTRKKCADSSDSVADRYGAVNIRSVKIVDAD